MEKKKRKRNWIEFSLGMKFENLKIWKYGNWNGKKKTKKKETKKQKNLFFLFVCLYLFFIPVPVSSFLQFFFCFVPELVYLIWFDLIWFDFFLCIRFFLCVGLMFIFFWSVKKSESRNLNFENGSANMWIAEKMEKEKEKESLFVYLFSKNLQFSFFTFFFSLSILDSIGWHPRIW